jgi:hypothetical protein
MNLSKVDSQSGDGVLAEIKNVHWSHHVCAATLVAGAILLITGRKRQALVIAAAGAVTTLLERPEAAQELWKDLPGHIRTGQDFLARAETFIQRISEQAARLRETISRPA